MAQGLATATLVGNLGKKIEMKYLDNGTAMLPFSIAVNRKNKTEEVTDWYDIVVYGKQAETLAGLLPKAKSVLVEGRLQKGSYTNKEGQKVVTISVIASNVLVLTYKTDGEQTEASPVGQPVAEEDYPF